MTDIVERLLLKKTLETVEDVHVLFADAADEIERLRTENQELKLQYLSDQGQWIEETGRLREALQKISEWDLTGTALAALGEKE